MHQVKRIEAFDPVRPLTSSDTESRGRSKKGDKRSMNAKTSSGAQLHASSSACRHKTVCSATSLLLAASMLGFELGFDPAQVKGIRRPAIAALLTPIGSMAWDVKTHNSFPQDLIILHRRERSTVEACITQTCNNSIQQDEHREEDVVLASLQAFFVHRLQGLVQAAQLFGQQPAVIFELQQPGTGWSELPKCYQFDL